MTDPASRLAEVQAQLAKLAGADFRYTDIPEDDSDVATIRVDDIRWLVDQVKHLTEALAEQQDESARLSTAFETQQRKRWKLQAELDRAHAVTHAAREVASRFGLHRSYAMFAPVDALREALAAYDQHHT